MNRKCLNIAITFDICSGFDVTGRAIELISDRLLGSEDSGGRPLRATWFVRADNQLESLQGSPAHLLDRFGRELDSLKADGHEIGWHPHIYRQRGGEWVLETDDDTLAKNLEAGFSAISERYRISAVRMGEGYHSSRCMELFDDLGLRVDSTAMPGRSRAGQSPFDWTGTPRTPYHPSRADYRVPGDDPLGILEVPMTMVPTKAEYDKKPLDRYIDLAFRSELLAGGIQAAVASVDLLVSITHPFEIVPQPERHALISFDISEAEKNLRRITDCCRDSGHPFRFVTLSEVPGLEDDP